MKHENAELKRSNSEVLNENQALLRDRERSRALFQNMKGKELLPSLALAAENNVECTSHSGDLPGSGGRAQHHQGRSGSTGSGGRKAVNHAVSSYYGLSGEESRRSLPSSSK